MTGTLRKTMLYLGLADDRGDGEVQQYVDEYEEVGPDMDEYQAPVTPIGRDQRPVRAVANPDPAGELRRIVTVHPRSYNDALIIGDAFRGGTPVIINLSDMDDANAKRLVDFAAGLTFGLHGAIERVTNKVFLLSPEHVEITGEERTGATPQAPRAGFFNQG